jgi:hypothetical protein
METKTESTIAEVVDCRITMKINGKAIELTVAQLNAFYEEICRTKAEIEKLKQSMLEQPNKKETSVDDITTTFQRWLNNNPPLTHRSGQISEPTWITIGSDMVSFLPATISTTTTGGTAA